MKFGISAWSIKNPIPISVLFFALLVAGLAGYAALPIKLFPDVSFPIVQVAVTLAGAAPSEVETQVTREIEGAVSNIANVDHVSSTVSLGLSATTVEFAVGADPQKATDEVRSAIDSVRATLPLGIEEPVVRRFDIDSLPVLTYAVSAPSMSYVELSRFIDDTVTRQVIGAKGVAKVARVGGVTREINVTLDPARVEALGLTAPQVNNALRGFSTDIGGVSHRSAATSKLSVCSTPRRVSRACANSSSRPEMDGQCDWPIWPKSAAVAPSGPISRCLTACLLSGSR
jgi:HAE1 family hydrophobic/amphiphilic exporter-1